MCVLDGSSTLQDWLVWDKHPIRKQYDVVMDLGESKEPAQLITAAALLAALALIWQTHYWPSRLGAE